MAGALSTGWGGADQLVDQQYRRPGHGRGAGGPARYANSDGVGAPVWRRSYASCRDLSVYPADIVLSVPGRAAAGTAVVRDQRSADRPPWRAHRLADDRRGAWDGEWAGFGRS